MAKPQFMTPSEFADKMQLSPQYVRRLVKNGKISKSAIKKDGKRNLIDFEKATRDLALNVSHTNKRALQPEVIEATKGTKGTNKKEFPFGDNRTKENTSPSFPGQQLIETKRPRNAEPGSDEARITIESAGLILDNFSAAQTLHEAYKAALKKMEFEKKMGELLPKAEVIATWSEAIATSRGKLLGIKGKLAPLLREFIDDNNNFNVLVQSIEDTIFEALEDLERGET